MGCVCSARQRREQLRLAAAGIGIPLADRPYRQVGAVRQGGQDQGAAGSSMVVAWTRIAPRIVAVPAVSPAI